MLGLGVIFSRAEKRAGAELLIVFRKSAKVGEKSPSTLSISIVEPTNVNEIVFIINIQILLSI